MEYKVSGIKEVIEKSGKKGIFRIVTLNDGTKLYAFDAATFQPIDQVLQEKIDVKFGYEQQGTYAHLKEIHFLNEPPMVKAAEKMGAQVERVEAAPQTKSSGETPMDNTRASIEAQVIYKGVVESGKLFEDERLSILCRAWGVLVLERQLPKEIIDKVDTQAKKAK